MRGLGLFRSIHDIEQTVVQTLKGVPVRIRDVANVVEGARPRLGIVGHDDEPDVVQGIVLMRYGGETGPTLEGIHQRVNYIRENHLLPPGMEIEPYYDRGELVRLTTHTVMENLLLGMLLVSIVLVFFLGNTRGALIAAVNIPLSLLVAFCGMVATGTPANLISLGAVDFGIIVDSTVIVVENIFRHLGSHGTGSMKEQAFGKRQGLVRLGTQNPSFLKTYESWSVGHLQVMSLQTLHIPNGVTVFLDPVIHAQLPSQVATKNISLSYPLPKFQGFNLQLSDLSRQPDGGALVFGTLILGP